MQTFMKFYCKFIILLFYPSQLDTTVMSFSFPNLHLSTGHITNSFVFKLTCSELFINLLSNSRWESTEQNCNVSLCRRNRSQCINASNDWIMSDHFTNTSFICLRCLPAIKRNCPNILHFEKRRKTQI